MSDGPGREDPDEHDDDEHDDGAPGLAGKPLVGHAQLEAHGGIAGCVIGLVFLVAGGGLAAAVQGLGPLPEDAQRSLPEWLPLVTLPFAALGVIMIARGLAGTLRDALRRRAVAARPEEPWLHDHPWHERRAQDRLRFRPGSLVGVVLFAAFLAPFHLVAARHGEGGGLAAGICGLVFFDLILLGTAGHAVYTLLRSLKYRGAELTWPAVPLLVGRPARLAFKLPPALAALVDPPRLGFTLRCLTERITTTRQKDGAHSSQTLVVALHEVEQHLSADQVDDEGKLELELVPPAGAPATDLISHEPIYWELEVKAETPGIDYRSLFLLPVY